MAAQNCDDHPKCSFTALEFFERSVYAASTYLQSRGEGTLVPMSGLALHPYQHTGAPGSKGRNSLETGIGKLAQVNGRLKTLCAKDANGRCAGPITRPDGGTPRLYLTEFGYLNRSVAKNSGTSPTLYFRETTRASRLSRVSSDPKKDGALGQALRHKAAAMLLFTLAEVTPPPGNPQDGAFDSGLIGQPQDYPAGDDDIVGCRPYGNGSKWSSHTCPASSDPNLYAQDRKAYCAVRRWAAKTGYIDRTQAVYANACG